MTCLYDPTAQEIETPGGPARWVCYDPDRQVVTVEVDHRYLVECDANLCFVPTRG